MATVATIEVADCACGHRVLLHEEGITPCAQCGRRLDADGTVLTPPIKRYTAAYVRTLIGGGLDRRVWKLNEPAAVGDVLFRFVLTASAPGETVVLASGPAGEPVDTTPLPGSFLGDEDHRYALDGLLSHLNHEED